MTSAPPRDPLTAEDLLARLGPIPLWRIRTDPPPGTATEDDVLRLYGVEGRFCELFDGILLEKDVSAESSLIGSYLLTMLNVFVLKHKLGFVLGEQGLLRLSIDRLRAPDISFVRREQVPGGRFPKDAVPKLYPTLAVEVLSPGNTNREMEEKLDDYFGAGSEAVWIVDPAKRTVRVYTDRNSSSILSIGDTLDGGSVLTGFAVPVADLFSVLELGNDT